VIPGVSFRLLEPEFVAELMRRVGVALCVVVLASESGPTLLALVLLAQH
jgi:hypothetical protein